MVQELPDSCLMDPIAFWLFSPYVGCITVSGYYSVFMYFLLFGVWDACGRCFRKCYLDFHVLCKDMKCSLILVIWY